MSTDIDELDAAWAAFADRVKAAADGNETVPTVFVGERSLVNPSMTELMDAGRAEAPQLLDN